MITIDEETYLIMKKLIVNYENKYLGVDLDNEPYFHRAIVDINIKYNPEYGDSRECECGHSYYRHFDPYEAMYPIGCKYCDCYKFVEKKDG